MITIGQHWREAVRSVGWWMIMKLPSTAVTTDNDDEMRYEARVKNCDVVES